MTRLYGFPREDNSIMFGETPLPLRQSKGSTHRPFDLVSAVVENFVVERAPSRVCQGVQSTPFSSRQIVGYTQPSPQTLLSSAGVLNCSCLPRKLKTTSIVYAPSPHFSGIPFLLARKREKMWVLGFPVYTNRVTTGFRPHLS